MNKVSQPLEAFRVNLPLEIVAQLRVLDGYLHSFEAQLGRPGKSLFRGCRMEGPGADSQSSIGHSSRSGCRGRMGVAFP